MIFKQKSIDLNQQTLIKILRTILLRWHLSKEFGLFLELQIKILF